MKSSSSYILLTMLIGSALIGMVAAQNTADITFTGDVPAVLIIRWENQRDLAWVFNESTHTACTNGNKVGDVCFFNDGSAQSSADLYTETNGYDVWDIEFAVGNSKPDSYLYRVNTDHTPAHKLNMTRHDLTVGDEYAPFGTKVWSLDSSDPDCSITDTQGGFCDVGIELQQGITSTEVSPGAGRLRQGTYSATIIADMVVT